MGMFEFFAIVIGVFFSAIICGRLSFRPLFDALHVDQAKRYPIKFTIGDLIGLAILIQAELTVYSTFKIVFKSQSLLLLTIVCVLTVGYWWGCLCLLYELRIRDTFRRITFYTFALPLGGLCGPLACIPTWYFGKTIIASGYQPGRSDVPFICFTSGPHRFQFFWSENHPELSVETALGLIDASSASCHHFYPKDVELI